MEFNFFIDSIMGIKNGNNADVSVFGATNCEALYVYIDLLIFYCYCLHHS